MELPFFTTTASSSSTTTQSEALRWLSIADKLLAGRDLVGSKSFATRARESDPTLLYAEQIIAVADTLLAGEKRINNNQPDWYSILQLPGNRTHDSELIAGQYRKLVLLLNPQKNKLPFADQAFNLVMSAWSVLSSPSRKAMFDNEFMAHLTANSPSGGFNPMFNDVSREQVNYPKPFELNFQVMPQHQQQQPSAQQQGMVTGQVNEMQQLHGMNREWVSLQIPSHNVGQEQMSHSMPQLNLSREQIWQSQAPPQPQPQLQPQPPPQQAQQQPQQLQQPQAQAQHTRQQQPQPQSAQPQPQQMQQRKEHWMDINASGSFSAAVGGTNAHIDSTRDGAQNDSNLNRNVVGGENREEAKVIQPSVDDESSFWTACPYCFYMYQYPKDYVECIFRCQNKKCRMAFYGEVIPSPPPIVEGQESNFCCWGTMPLGISMNTLERNMGGAKKWTPFSPVFNGPAGAGNNGTSGNVNFFGSWNANNNVQRQRSGYMGGRPFPHPRVYVEEDEYSEPSDDSDDDWRTFERKARAKGVKVKTAVVSGRNTRRGKNVNGVGSDAVSDDIVL